MAFRARKCFFLSVVIFKAINGAGFRSDNLLLMDLNLISFALENCAVDPSRVLNWYILNNSTT